MRNTARNSARYPSLVIAAEALTADTDESHAACKDCGADFGPYGDIKKRAIDLVKSDVNRKIKEAFKGVKGFKIT
ncbi:hypothetical protein ABIF90_000801 [Bradyrhizobium japonicum]